MLLVGLKTTKRGPIHDKPFKNNYFSLYGRTAGYGKRATGNGIHCYEAGNSGDKTNNTADTQTADTGTDTYPSSYSDASTNPNASALPHADAYSNTDAY